MLAIDVQSAEQSGSQQPALEAIVLATAPAEGAQAYLENTPEISGPN